MEYPLWQYLCHPFTSLLLAFCCITLLWAMLVEPDRTPDELDHYDYILQLARTHTLPRYGQTATRRDPAVLNTEAQRPPLYYMLAVPLQHLVDQRSDF